jgi:DNA-directed RNA polymerase specialized sigma24 family protein
MEELISAVIAGDPAAWSRFWLELEPRLHAIAGKRRFTGPLSELEDERHNIVAAVMTRLRAHDFRRLRDFLVARAQPGSRSFQTWIVTFAVRTAIDYVRTHPEYQRPARNDEAAERASGPRWAGFEPPPDSKSAPAAPGVDVPRLVTAQRILARAPHLLTREQYEALMLWLSDEEHDEIARALGLPNADAAEKLVRAAVKRLRRYYPS